MNNIKKSIYVLCVLVVSVTLYLLFFDKPEENTTKDVKTKEIKKNNNIAELKIESNTSDTVYLKKITKDESIPIIYENQQMPILEVNKNDSAYEEKKTKVFNSISQKGNYSVSIVSDKKIKKEYIGAFIPISGILKYEDKMTSFTISLPLNYKNDSSLNLNIEVYDINKNQSYLCDGYFLKDLDQSFFHNLEIELSNQIAICNIMKDKKIPYVPPATEEEEDGKPINLEHLAEHFKKMKKLN